MKGRPKILSLFDSIGQLGSLGLPGLGSLLGSLNAGGTLRSQGAAGTRSKLLRLHNDVWRRSLSRYPDPVPPSLQHQANARRRDRGWS